MGRELNLFYTTVHERNINSVRLLVDTVIPVRYSPEFYKDLVRTPADFTKMGSSLSLLCVVWGSACGCFA